MANVVIKYQGLRELREACKRMDKELDDKAMTGALKTIHYDIAEKVLGWARPSMPGRLSSMYRAGREQSGAAIKNKAGIEYAGSNEFGGRIPNRGSKGAGAHAAASKHARGTSGTHQHKPPMGGNSSYFIYPAIYAHDVEIKTEYDRAIRVLWDKIS